MSIDYLAKLEILITQVLPLRCQPKKLQNVSHLNCDLQMRQIWIQLTTACRNTAREGVQNTHHWSGWTETSTENGVNQAGSRRRCSSHSSVGSSDSCRSVMHVLYTSLAIFPHAVINWIQIWRIWMPEMRLSLIHIWRCRRSTLCRSRWSPYH